MDNFWHLLRIMIMFGFVKHASCLACRGVKYGSCDLQDNNTHLICVGQSPYYSNITTTEKSKLVANLTICAWMYKSFKVMKHIGHLTNLQHFTLRRSGVEQVESFRNHQHLQSINLTQLHLTRLEKDLFWELRDLHSLDLRNNYLSILDLQLFNTTPNIQEIYLAGNNWTCDPRLIWMISDCESCFGGKVRDKDQLSCEGKSKAMPKPLVKVMNFIKVMQEQCPRPCNCSVDHVVFAHSYLVTERGKLLPHIKVNCNLRNLTSMPDHLPEYTTALFLRNNNLTSVEELVYNKDYRDLREIYLDNNQITAINILEGTHWLNNFGVFNLRGNRLRQIPLYALDHAFQSQKLSHIYLGNNPWRCDCEFTIYFRDFVQKYSSVIKDLHDIRCEKIDGDKNSNKKIIDLNRKDLCLDHTTIKLSFIDKLNIFLAGMILLVLTTFLYNFTVYKTTGKLPWMVEKFF